MKLGRNDPCHCGSGLKYKKCCHDSDRAPAPRATRDEHGLLVGREAIETEWEAQGKVVRAVGNTISIGDQDQTRHEFYVDNLCHEFGKEWHEAQLALSEDKRHPVEQWVELWGKARAGEFDSVKITREGEHLYSANATGDLKALLCLAYDLYTLRHGGALPKPLAKRLRIKDQFQGARYEVAIAAVFLRAGYELDWLTDTDRKLPEFNARSGSAEIAVEAKSRHRPGVLGRSGEVPDVDALEADVETLLARALEKETDHRPFVVCLDLNLPVATERSVEEWAAGLQNRVLSDYAPTTGERDPFSALMFTNYSWHWDGHNPAGNPIQVVVRGNEAAVPVPWKQLDPVIEAVFQYGNVPS